MHVRQIYGYKYAGNEYYMYNRGIPTRYLRYVMCERGGVEVRGSGYILCLSTDAFLYLQKRICTPLS